MAEGAPSGYVLGVDIGGTCTDVTMVDVATAEQFFFKTESVPKDIAGGVVEGIRGILAQQQRRAEDCRAFVHGATLALNAVLTRTGARLGLLVTKGFGDILEMARMQMPDPFNLYTQKPEPLVRRQYVAEVAERIGGTGQVLAPLDEADLLRAVDALAGRGVQTLALCFINAYLNPAHEQAAAALIRRARPELTVSLSSEVWPEVREYERAMVTVMNAYVAPRVAGYLDSLQARLQDIALPGPLNVTTSNGGMLPARLVRERPGTTLLSGPAAGVIACSRVAAACGIDNLIGLDMGGTSTDLAALTQAQIPYSTETRIGDFPVIFPSVEVISVGAGGGSIARLDNLGIVKVGPESAGADPGPVCYGRGGTRPTVTDAYVATGIIDPGNFLGGRVRLRRDLALLAFEELAEGTPYSPQQLAEGVLRVATSNLIVGIGRVEAAKGIDIRDYAMLAYGGAGPTHACLLADMLGMRRIVVPRSPGTFCAWGSVLADFRYDYVQSLRSPAAALDFDYVRRWFADRAEQGTALLRRETPLLESSTALRTADMRYRGQGFDVSVPLTDALLASNRPDDLAAAFHARYQEVYGIADRAIPVEVVNLRLTLIGHTRELAMRPLPAAEGEAAPAGRREVFSDGAVTALPVYRRADLGPGRRIEGPCLVDQADTTVFVRGGWSGSVDRYGILHLSARAA